ncbi:septum formation initiator family protein [Microbacterium horticulturae]|uniref:Septum formation initiator family protein n=1 Tax=Microbacterium horticulturae TaxID=3028316 RepID=A0ABY8BTW7_9MICO|nr:septum formation initiator family protein [Microbacterium sp. KACC 23027]WEG07611.1 septum formation initiator family protein [Microbacterium sp. KACC 23027]
MVRRPTPPSPVSETADRSPQKAKKTRDAASTPRRTVDVRAWLAGSRLSGFTAIMLGLVVIAVFVLVPTVGTYIGQRQQIAELEHSVQVTKEQIAELNRQRTRWDDPAYITTQARERLYFTKPSEIVYLVEDDLPDTDIPRDKAPVSDTVQTTKTDWMSQFVRSLAASGLAKTAVASTDDPGSSRHPAPSPSGSR